jgi:hypothetical protein
MPSRSSFLPSSPAILVWELRIGKAPEDDPTHDAHFWGVLCRKANQQGALGVIMSITDRALQRLPPSTPAE